MTFFLGHLIFFTVSNRLFSFSRHVIVLVGVILVPLHVVAINQRLDALLQISRLKKKHTKIGLSIILEEKKNFLNSHLDGEIELIVEFRYE